MNHRYQTASVSFIAVVLVALVLATGFICPKPTAALLTEPEGAIADAGTDTEAPTAQAADSPSPRAIQGRSWLIEAIDEGRYFDQLNNRMFAIDPSNGDMHVAYGGDHLYYAFDDGSGWEIEIVDDSIDVGATAALALSAGGVPSISYYDAENGALKFARRRCLFDNCWWQIWTVDDAGDVGENSSLAIHADGGVHISYHNYSELKYAYWNGQTGSSWQTEVVDSERDVGEWSSIAVDSSGYPHIAYYDETRGFVKYARWDGSNWQIEDVYSHPTAGEYISLALDEFDHAYISYFYDTTVVYVLRYAHWTGDAWLHSTVPNPDNLKMGYATSIVLDSSGSPHISYYDATNYNVGYANLDESTWHVEAITTTYAQHNEGYTSLALDPDEDPHIMYLSSSSLDHVYWDGSAWQTETVDSTSAPGSENALVLDRTGAPHVTYYVDGTKELGYAHWNGTAWQTERLVQYHGLGRDPVIALDSADNPYIVYKKEALRSKHWDGATWQDSTFAVGGSNAEPSLALDSSDRAHVSYYNGSADELTYAYWDGSAWQTETVDNTADAGRASSLVLDDAGRPHISYYILYDGINDDMAYAYYNGTTWITDTFDTVYGMVYDTSLALDSSGHPHVVYHDYIDQYTALYAYYDGTSWITDTIATGHLAGCQNSLALDSEDRPHVAYSSDYDVFYAYHDGTDWVIETVAENAMSPSLVLDSSDQPRISFYDSRLRDLMYAYSCTSLDSVTISGPDWLPIDGVGTYTAIVSPADAMGPVTIRWDSGANGTTADYSWPDLGMHTITVRAESPCGVAVEETFSVDVRYATYLPLVVK